jgi:hypothetical protein
LGRDGQVDVHNPPIINIIVDVPIHISLDLTVPPEGVLITGNQSSRDDLPLEAKLFEATRSSICGEVRSIGKAKDKRKKGEQKA